MVKKYLVTVQTQTPDQAGTFLETFIYSITQSWEKNYKNVFHWKTSEEIFINTQNPDLNCQVYHKRTSLFCNHFASFGRASDRGITWGPTNVFACQNLQKFRECAQKLHFLTATKNSPFNLKMIINRNRSLRLHWKDFEYEKEMSTRETKSLIPMRTSAKSVPRKKRTAATPFQLELSGPS